MNDMSQNFNHSRSGNKTRSHVQIISTPTADTPGTALLLSFDDKRYVIGNVHEGLQRAALQLGTRFFKAKDFFLTGRTEWQSNGGLLGMILSLADATKASTATKAENAKIRMERRLAREEDEQLNSRKKSKRGQPGPAVTPQEIIVPGEDPTVTLHGGPNLTHTVATARSFIFRHGTPIKVIENHNEKDMDGQEQNWNSTWVDERVQMWAMAIEPAESAGNSTPVSPRKRSLGHYMRGQSLEPLQADDQWFTQPTSIVNDEERNQQIREFVVSEMFSSNWRFDNLVETPLQEVVMPAGLYIRDPKTKQLVKYTGPTPDGTTAVPDIKVLVRQPWPGALVDHLPATRPSQTSMSYIIRNHRQRGKFKPETAAALNVPPGPLWRALATGSDVQSSDGKTVTSDMVLEPGKEGGGIAVIDLPTKEYICNLIERPEWNVEKIMAGVGAIVWILGPGVSGDEKLRGFMDNKRDMNHIISSPDHCPNYLVQTSAATAAIRHNQIDPTRFPIPVHSNSTPIPLPSSTCEPPKEECEPPEHLLPAQRGLKINLEPTFRIVDTDVVPYLNTALVSEQTPADVIKFAQDAQNHINSSTTQTETNKQGLPSQDAEIICLGTGSALPSTNRNVSGTLLRVPGHGSYLLDCGENTLGQLKRVFTQTELAEVLHDLKLIWVSHLHADHHLGITSVIKAWYEEVHGEDASKRDRPTLTAQLLNPAKFLEEGNPLFIVAHGHMMRWLEEYSSVEDFGYDKLRPLISFPTNWRQPDRSHLEWNGINVGFNTAKDPRLRSAIRKATSLSNLVAVPVSHCYGAQAVSLTFPNGFKFSYSGDCRPSKEFAIIGKGSTVLLHEATFDDELVGDAKAKKHSTTGEAIGVGVAMGARRVLLTHFSQRYQKIASINSMDRLRVNLESADDVDDPMEEMGPPVSAEDEPSVVRQVSSVSPQKLHLEGTRAEIDESAGPTTRNNKDSDATFASLHSMTNLIRAPANDMKIGVAFDYMRVKVGDIMHLDKFTPALRELYKEVEKEEAIAKAETAAREELPDDEKHVSQTSKSEGQEVREASKKSDRKQKKKEKRESYKSLLGTQKAGEAVEPKASEKAEKEGASNPTNNQEDVTAIKGEIPSISVPAPDASQPTTTTESGPAA